MHGDPAEPTLYPLAPEECQYSLWRVTLQSVKHRYVSLDGVNMFYREAGQPGNPPVLLLHGFPSSSIQFRYVLADLSDRWHLIAPDLPGFGCTTFSEGSQYRFTFANLANTVRRFIEQLDLHNSAVYLHDYGAQVGFRLLTDRILRPSALVIQNAEAYRGTGWHKMMWGVEERLTEPPAEARSRLLAGLLNREGIEKEFLEALPAEVAECIDPAVIELNWSKLKQADVTAAMLELHFDYGSNIQHYPKIQAYFQDAQPPTLLLWGERDQYLSVEAAQAYKRDLPNLELKLLTGGHWVLESHVGEVSAALRDFLLRHAQ
jgi:pimeloyl-ACP methyl ester carboxylesterase